MHTPASRPAKLWKGSASSRPWRDAFFEAIAHPEALLSEGALDNPLRTAAGTCLGLCGWAAWGALTSLIDDGTSNSPNLSGALALPPLVFALSFPPLALIAALGGRPSGWFRLAAVTAAGPAVAGTALLTLSPVLALYALTDRPGLGFGLTWVAFGLGALAAGTIGAVRTARLAGPVAPGVPVVLGHVAFTFWTLFALGRHLLAS
jgi:hypothetical protein